MAGMVCCDVTRMPQLVPADTIVISAGDAEIRNEKPSASCHEAEQFHAPAERLSGSNFQERVSSTSATLPIIWIVRLRLSSP
jgi:hypothetical protein